MIRSRAVQAGAAAVTAVLVAAGFWLVNRSGNEGGDTPPGSRTAVAVAVPNTPAMSAAEREAADRAEIERVWATFQTLYPTMTNGYAQSQWAATVAEVAVDPIKKQVLTAAAANLRAGVTGYGTAVPHPSWPQPIAGKNTAVMSDCLDASRAGSKFTKSGYKRTVGVARSSIRAYFVKGGDGRWRVRQIAYHVDEKC